MDNHLVIGLGQVGSAIQKILQCSGHDAKTDARSSIPDADVIHICFPYSDKFVEYVSQYHKETGAKHVVIHSTVPVGTCDTNGWIHSPVRGIHPNLEEGIRTFVKYFGGVGAYDAAKAFHLMGVRVIYVDRAAETEAMKLWDTTIYGWNILIEKAIKKYCKDRGLSFNTVYTSPNQTYNEGYRALSHPEYQKYVLEHVEGPIGGHCVRQNWDLLDDPIADISRELHDSGIV